MQIAWLRPQIYEIRAWEKDSGKSNTGRAKLLSGIAAENLFANPLEMLASGDRYKIIDTCVALKNRCVAGSGHIA
jgi:hypothetical protein